LTSNKQTASSYIYNHVKEQWEYFSSKRRVWKADFNNKKFIKFLKETVLPHIKKLSKDALENLPYLINILNAFTSKYKTLVLIQNVLIKLMPLLTTAGVALLSLT